MTDKLRQEYLKVTPVCRRGVGRVQQPNGNRLQHHPTIQPDPYMPTEQIWHKETDPIDDNKIVLTLQYVQS
jgi:hypothetical protein